MEGARAALGEAGYEKLQAAIRTLGYVTELLETRQAALDKLRFTFLGFEFWKLETVAVHVAAQERAPTYPGSGARSGPIVSK